ncbi:MAG: hypothetical protein AB1798_15340 [Spirochaetota bacterium]
MNLTSHSNRPVTLAGEFNRWAAVPLLTAGGLPMKCSCQEVKVKADNIGGIVANAKEILLSKLSLNLQ